MKNTFSSFRVFHVALVLVSVNILFLSLAVYFHKKIQSISFTPVSAQVVYKNSPLPFVAKNIDVKTSARALVVYDPETRTVVYGKNQNFRFAPASTTKIMTALIALENYNLNKVMTANGVWTVQGSKMNLVEGERITVHSLLYGLMLPSGNDAAYVLAHNYPGGYTDFMQKMNEKAKKLYLQNTFFVDPAGLEDANYTTASDLARLAAYAMQNDVFRTVVGTKTKTVLDASGMIPHELVNLNKLLDLPGVIGVKTGFTEEAGQVLATAYQYQGKTYIIVVLQSTDRFSDTATIIKEVVDKIKLISY